MTTRGHQGLLMGVGGGGGGDPYITSRVSILNLDSDLTDAKGKVWTANGGAVVSSGWLNLDGSGDYLTTPQSTDFDFGSGDFCIEAFINIAPGSSGNRCIAAKWSASSLSWRFLVETGGRLALYMRLGGTTRFHLGPILPTGTNVHVAIYRIGTTMYGTLNGSHSASDSSFGTLSITATVQPTSIGSYSDASNFFNGKIRGVRITKGSSGGYGASNFTPPSFPLPTS